jgi:P-type Cu2+ transporter
MDQMTHEARGHVADSHAGHHDRHPGHSVTMFRDKFWLSLALTIPVVFWSTDVQRWLGGTRRLPSPARNLFPPSSCTE